MITVRQKILIVDDEAAIRRFLRISLEAQGFEVVEADTGMSGLSKLTSEDPGVVILDLGLPDMEGLRTLEAIRAISTLPVLVLSVRAGEQEKIAALDAGANDYVTKPFSIGELTARIRAVLRHSTGVTTPPTVLEIGGLKIDIPRHKVSLDQNPVRLSPKEFQLLTLLASNPGRVLTHSYILREIWGPGHEADAHYLRIYVGQLRHKLGDDPAAPRFIHNEPGVGYRLLEPQA